MWRKKGCLKGIHTGQKFDIGQLVVVVFNFFVKFQLWATGFNSARETSTKELLLPTNCFALPEMN